MPTNYRKELLGVLKELRDELHYVGNRLSCIQASMDALVGPVDTIGAAFVNLAVEEKAELVTEYTSELEEDTLEYWKAMSEAPAPCEHNWRVAVIQGTNHDLWVCMRCGATSPGPTDNEALDPRGR